MTFAISLFAAPVLLDVPWPVPVIASYSSIQNPPVNITCLASSLLCYAVPAVEAHSCESTYPTQVAAALGTDTTAVFASIATA